MDSTSITFIKHTLGNGLDVIIHSDHNVPVVSVNVWYHVGSKNEVAGKTGFAHLFEHVMFEGSKHHNRDYFEPLQKIGANVNGSTNNDRTNYWQDLPSEYLELALWLESDRMGFLAEALDNRRFDLQREVVKNERRQSYENVPYGNAHLRLQEILFPSPHPYHWPTIGSQKDLDSASLEDVKAFYNRYYRPSNASISITGDIDPEDAINLVDKYFGDLPPGPPIDRFTHMDSPLSGTSSLILEDNVSLTRLYLAWPTVPDFTVMQPAYDLLSMILADGKSSRLYKNLVYGKQIAKNVKAYQDAQEIAGSFHITSTCNHDTDPDMLQEELLAELHQISSSPPNSHEMQRAFNRLESYHVRQLEKIGGFSGKADQLNYYNVIAGDVSLINTDIDRYRHVSPQDVSQAAAELSNNRVVLEIIPRKQHHARTDKINRETPPHKSTSRNFDLPKVQRHNMGNGVNILLVERTGLPLVSIGLLFGTGGSDDPPEVPGISSFLASMLVEGTSSRTSQEISEHMEFLGSQITTHVAREYTILAAEGLTQHFEQIMELLGDVVSNPTFPEREIERLRKETLSNLNTIVDSPTAIAEVVTAGLLYGNESPYGHSLHGSKNAIGALTKSDLLNHYKSVTSVAPLYLVLIGDIDIDKAKKTSEQYLLGRSSCKSNNPPSKKNPDHRTLSPTKLYLVDKPGSPQSIIRAGHLIMSREHEDFDSFSFLNYIIGGDYSSRLNMNLRQDKGYSYGFHSSISWVKTQSAWLARGSVQSEVTKESIIEIINEVSSARGEMPITEEEFHNAKDGILKSIPAQYATQRQIMGQVLELASFNLPDNYLDTKMKNIKELKISDIQGIAKRGIQSDNLTIVIVGDLSNIQPELSQLGIPIEVIDINDYLN